MIHFDDIEISCPYCGEINFLNIEIGNNSSDEFITDCEICCRPFTVNVQSASNGEISFDVKNNDGF
ncbi:MAG: CPXCG motif-containing cysteine-rich protein [Ignavibacteria bacterium]